VSTAHRSPGAIKCDSTAKPLGVASTRHLHLSDSNERLGGGASSLALPTTPEWSHGMARSAFS
jgi:hypothetical protein